MHRDCQTECFIRTSVTAVIVAIIVTGMIIKKCRRRMGQQEGGPGGPPPPTAENSSYYKKLGRSVPSSPSCQPSLFQPGKRLPVARPRLELGGALCNPCAALHSITWAPRPGIAFPPWLVSAVLCVASWKHSRHEALLNHSFPRVGTCYLVNKGRPG